MITKLETLYSSINSENLPKILSGQETTDPILRAPENDKRFGITLLIPIHGSTAKSLCSLENEIRAIEPDLYFYPESDLHITVLDLIAAHENFKRDNDLIQKFVRIIEKAVSDIPPFDISFKGIIASNAGILAKGYYRNGVQEIRSRMRAFAESEGINFRERYQTISAHVTIARFKSAIRNRQELSSHLHTKSDREIGIMTVNELRLVIHDWYNRRKEDIVRFALPATSNKLRKKTTPIP